MATASIQARMGSTRLPGKILLAINEHRVVDLVARRCEEASTVDHLVFAVGDEDPNAAVTEWCERREYRYIVGPEDDLLKRHRQVLEETGDDVLIRVTGDCPFVPPTEIDRIVRLHENHRGGYTTNATDRMPLGTAVDAIDGSTLADLADLGDTHPALRLRKSPGEWGAVIDDDTDWTDLGAAHTAVDTPEDYWRLVDATRDVGFDPHEVTAWIANNR